jgi:ribonuclease E
LGDDEADDGERKRGRSRRRRRGGRGRKSGDRPAQERSSSPQPREPLREDEFGVEFDDVVEDEDEPALIGNGTDVADGDEIDMDDEGGSSSGKSAAQRAIPSWDEAIGFIVDSNMQSRSQRRPPSRSDSRGNSSRGRSRGGRRRS